MSAGCYTNNPAKTRAKFEGRFPKSDDGRSWDREVVARYAQGGIREFERQAEKRKARGQIQMVGGAR